MDLQQIIRNSAFLRESTEIPIQTLERLKNKKVVLNDSEFNDLLQKKNNLLEYKTDLIKNKKYLLNQMSELNLQEGLTTLQERKLSYEINFRLSGVEKKIVKTEVDLVETSNYLNIQLKCFLIKIENNPFNTEICTIISNFFS